MTSYVYTIVHQTNKILEDTITAYHKAVDYIYKGICDNNYPDDVTTDNIQHDYYYVIRDEFKLPAQLAVRAVRDGCRLKKDKNYKPICHWCDKTCWIHNESNYILLSALNKKRINISVMQIGDNIIDQDDIGKVIIKPSKEGKKSEGHIIVYKKGEYCD